MASKGAIAKKLIGNKVIFARRLFLIDYNKKHGSHPSRSEQMRGTLKTLASLNLVSASDKDGQQMQFARQLGKIVRRMSLKNSVIAGYYYPLDTKYRRVRKSGTQPVTSLTADYGYVLTLTADSLKAKVASGDSPFHKAVKSVINSIETLRTRSVKYLKSLKESRADVIARYMEQVLEAEPGTLDEALQKILFFNSMLWQAGHAHNGLGRLDKILLPYYQRDVQSGKLTREGAKQMLMNFMTVLGSHLDFKSGVLKGDTGQVILLGGKTKDAAGKVYDVENELTYIFLESMTRMNIPDPKLILRVSEQTSEKLWNAALECIATGNGSPLIANDTLIRAQMENFGYEADDCYEFGTSACWEPLIIGRSFDQNNSIPNISAVRPLSEMIAEGHTYDSYDHLEREFLRRLEEHILDLSGGRDSHIDVDVSPLLSIYYRGCLESGKDVSLGGARYNYHGFLVNGLPNLVNSLLNIEELVFEKGTLSQEQLHEAIKADFRENEPLRTLLQNQKHKFGETSDRVISVTNRLMGEFSRIIGTITVNGEKSKVGFSSPNYIADAKNCGPTADGRRAGEPFGVHISPVSHDIGIAEVLDFASELDYSENRINGNVVDFIINNGYLADREKFIGILRTVFSKGIYELQLNVVDAQKLMEAKLNPKLYPHLVVRVWGFNAYFNDLPEDYKDNLINRAKLYA